MPTKHENIYRTITPDDISVSCDNPKYIYPDPVPYTLSNLSMEGEIEVFDDLMSTDEWRKSRVTLEFLNDILELLQEASKTDPSVLEKFNKLMDKYSDGNDNL